MLIETVRGNVADEPWSRAASVDELRLDQWEAQKNRLRKSTEAGVPLELSLDRGTRLADGDVLWADPAGARVIVARLDMGEVMVVDLPTVDPADPAAALRAAVELGRALGNQHWPAVIQEGQVLVPVTVDRRVMDSVMCAHAFPGVAHRFAAEPPRTTPAASAPPVWVKKISRIGVGGPVGSGKTAVIEAVVPRLVGLGLQVLVVTNDAVTTEDAEHMRRALRGVLHEERILGVQTGTCPHMTVGDAVDDMEARFPDTDVVLIESGGDNLTPTLSPALLDYFVYVIDVAAGDKIPRKNGAGISRSDVLVINKVDLAPYVDADLGAMADDAEVQRAGRPMVFANCKTGHGIDELVTHVTDGALFDLVTRSG